MLNDERKRPIGLSKALNALPINPPEADKRVKPLTKDKIGEISLNFVLLIEALDILNNPMYKFSWRTAQRYVNYMVNKLFRTCMLINKLHVDLHIELEDEAHKLGKIIGANDNLMKQMIRVMFDVNWLLELDIPEDIDKHYKEIRQQGFLR